MGILEDSARKRLRRGQIESVILGTLIAGSSLISLSGYGMVRALKRIDSNWFNKRDPRQRIRETISKMKTKRQIEFVRMNGKVHMQLTAEGKRLARQIVNGNTSIPKPRKWDGQWRIVIFDIPEQKKELRDRVRYLVKRLGFYKLQQSVWVHPYECEEIITLLKTDLRVGKDLLYIVGTAIEFDKPLRRHFGIA